MIVAIAKLTLKDGVAEEFKTLVTPLIKKSKKEQGCIEYNLFKHNEKEIFTFIEKWETMEDLKSHFLTPHFKEIVPQFKDYVTKEELDLYEEV